MDKVYKTIIVDDHPIVIEGLKNLLNGIKMIAIESTFNKGSDLFEYAYLGSIDLLFLDIFLSDSNGIDLCLKIKRMYPKIIVLAMSSQSERSIVMQMIKNGANGYLLKTASIEEFKRCINDSVNGKLAFCNEVGEIVNKISVSDLQAIPRLTLREKEIVALLKKGKSTQEISDALFLSHLTVQTHRRNLLSKFKVKNVVELLNFINENGLY